MMIEPIYDLDSEVGTESLSFRNFKGMVKNLSNEVTVEVKDGAIHVLGIKTEGLLKSFMAIYRYARVFKSMTLDGATDSFGFTLDPFFLIEFVHALESIRATKYVRVARPKLNDLIFKLRTLPEYSKYFDDNYQPKGERLDFKRLDDFTVTPLPHQRRYMEEYDTKTTKFDLNGHLAHVGVGGGKTYLSLFVMQCARVQTTICIVLKNTLHEAWRKTLLVSHKTPVKFWDSASNKPPDPGCSHYVVHFEYLPKFLAFMSEHRESMGEIGIIVDECHHFNDVRSQRTQSLIELCDMAQSKNVLWMSGTPLKAIGSECIALMRTTVLLFKRRGQDTYKAFRDIYNNSSDAALTILARRLDILSYKVDVSEFMTKNELIVHTAKVKIPNASAYTLSTIKTKMTEFAKQRMEYYKANEEKYHGDYFAGIRHYEEHIRYASTQDKMAFKEYQDGIKFLRKGYDPILHKELLPQLNTFEKRNIIPTLPSNLREPFKKAKSVYKYVSLTIVGECLGNVLGRERINCNVDLATHLYDIKVYNEENQLIPEIQDIDDIIANSEKKVLMFTSYVEVLRSMDEHLKNKKYKPVIVYGETSKNLTPIIKDFSENPKTNPLLATFQSLSTGVPITAANTVVMLNAPFRDIEYKQAYGRAYRVGQDKDVYVYNVFLDTGEEPNISTRSKDIMETMAHQVAIMLGMKEVDLSGAGLEDINSNNYVPDEFANTLVNAIKMEGLLDQQEEVNVFISSAIESINDQTSLFSW